MALKLCLCAGACLVVAQTTAQSNDLQVKKGLKTNTFVVVLSLKEGWGLKLNNKAQIKPTKYFNVF